MCQEGVKWVALVMACSRQDSSRQLKSVPGTQAEDLTRKNCPRPRMKETLQRNCPQAMHGRGVAEELPPGHGGGLARVWPARGGTGVEM